MSSSHGIPFCYAYEKSAAEGRPTNFGFSASWAVVRMNVLAGEPMTGWAMGRIITVSARAGGEGPRLSTRRQLSSSYLNVSSAMAH
jgi:hypothetical protein